MTARAPDFFWNGQPVFRCRWCQYERVDNLSSVEQHEAGHMPAERESLIVGPQGEALRVPVTLQEETEGTAKPKKARRARA
jgi:hypothetical protein